MGVQEKIDDVYVQCSQNSGSATFEGIVKTFWPVLNNSISLIDLSGVFSISVSEEAAGLTIAQFSEFFYGIARIKFPNTPNYCEELLGNLQDAKKVKVSANPVFLKSITHDVAKLLLTFDFQLRRAYSSFAGDGAKIGGGLSWEEVKRMQIPMEIDGFISFSGAYNLIPNVFNMQQCSLMARNFITSFPLIAGNKTMHTSLFYPQFQLLLCAIAHEKYDLLVKEAQNPPMSAKGEKPVFAKKLVSPEDKSMADIFSDLLRTMGIDKKSSLTTTQLSPRPFSPSSARSNTQSRFEADDKSVFSGTVTLPSIQGLDNPSAISSTSATRQAMLMRLDYMFENDINYRLQSSSCVSPPNIGVLLSVNPDDDGKRARVLLNKPVVISDAIPVPSIQHESVDQMLQAALAHHNLGNFNESLQFLEASRVQLFEIERGVILRRKRKEMERARENELDSEIPDDPSTKPKITQEMIDSIVVADSEVIVPLHVEMYVLVCKGNVYQSCGDDEMALKSYLIAWNHAISVKNKEWEVMCINCIGLVAYYNVRYDVALVCFAKVAHYRAEIYGQESADTATAWNNEACALYCLEKRGDSRVRFDKAWNLLCKSLGHRHPRCIQVWKNLDKAKRSQATFSDKSSIAESVKLRADAEFLIPGEFHVNAVLPDAESKSKGKKKKGKKGKK